MENNGTEKIPEYTPGQLMRVAVVYEFLAKSLPTEGKDYAVRITFPNKDDPSSLSVKLEPFTKIGKIWCDYCTEALMGANK